MSTDMTLRPCPECKAPLTVIDGKAQGRVVLSGDVSVGAHFITPHTDECTTRTEDHPLPTIGWGVGPFVSPEFPETQP